MVLCFLYCYDLADENLARADGRIFDFTTKDLFEDVSNFVASGLERGFLNVPGVKGVYLYLGTLLRIDSIVFFGLNVSPTELRVE